MNILLFLIFIIIKNIYNQIVSLNGKKNISPENFNFIERNKIIKIGNVINQKFDSTSIKVYNNMFFSFKILTNNNDFGIGPNFFLRTYINNKNIPLNQIKIKYLAEKYVFNSKSLNDYEFFNDDFDYNLNCTYLIKNPTFNFNVFYLNNNYSKIENAFQNFFALFDNKIYLINDYKNDKILLENINNFFVLKDKKSHVFFLIVFYNNNNFSLFKINFDENKFFLNLTKIFESNFNNNIQFSY